MSDKDHYFNLLYDSKDTHKSDKLIIIGNIYENKDIIDNMNESIRGD